MIETLTVTQWITICLSAVLISMSKTGIQGITALTVPYMAIAFGAKESTGIILPMLCMADIIAVCYFRKKADWKAVVRLLPAAVAGFFIAIWVDDQIPASDFRFLLGITLLTVFLVMLWSEFTGSQNRWAHAWWFAPFFGLLGGFVTMIGNAAGAVMAIYLLSMRKEKMELIRQCMARLPDKQRKVLEMRIFDNVPYPEIALRTGLSEENVRVKMSNARKNLKKMIDYEENR